MENLKSAITLMSPNCYMASIDLKDAYYSVSIDTNHRKYLRFVWKNQLFQFTCLPNGLSVHKIDETSILNSTLSRFPKCGIY